MHGGCRAGAWGAPADDMSEGDGVERSDEDEDTGEAQLMEDDDEEEGKKTTALGVDACSVQGELGVYAADMQVGDDADEDAAEED